MQNSDIFTTIHTTYNSFTNTEKKVANQVLKNRTQIIYMSITDLADRCGVGESSIFRFCKTLGFKGYQEFKIAMAHSLNSEEETPQIDKEILRNDSLEDLTAKVKNTNISALDETHSLIDYSKLDKAVSLLVGAERIRFFGVGASLITAMEGYNKFLRITAKSEFTVDQHLQAMTASLMTEKDVAVIISYSGSTKDTIEVARAVKEAGAKTICITRFVKSPLTAYSDITLLCGANEGPLQGGSLSAKIAQLYLLDVLYFEYFKRTFDISAANKEKTAKAVVEKLL